MKEDIPYELDLFEKRTSTEEKENNIKIWANKMFKEYDIVEEAKKSSAFFNEKLVEIEQLLDEAFILRDKCEVPIDILCSEKKHICYSNKTTLISMIWNYHCDKIAQIICLKNNLNSKIDNCKFLSEYYKK